MKFKYRHITVPYFYNDTKENYSYYIYHNRKYKDLNKLFTKFIGFYLTYHYEIKDNIKEVHNLSDVLYDLIKNYDTFKIPRKYQKEYSSNELEYIKELQTKLKNNSLKVEYIKENDSKLRIKDFLNRKLIKFNNKIYNKYKDVIIPKKIYSKEFKNNYYIVAGEAYESIYHALDAVFDKSLYYQFGGTKNQNNRTHKHSHSFDDLIALIFSNANNFKIHVSQREFYSEQELTFLTKLSEKLREMKFQSVSRNYDDLDIDEYIYLKENKNYLRLLIHNIKFYWAEKKYQKEVLKSHKI